MLDFIGIKRDKLPPIFASHEVVGNVSPQVKSELGLSTNTKVVAGSMDQMAASLGAMLLAGEGARIFPDISQAVKEVVKIKKSFYPELSNVAIYQKVYQDYLSLYQKLYGKI